MQILPKKLKKEPLIDAVFEVRFTSAFPAGGVLPGLLFGNLDGDKKIEQLPLLQLPQVIRDADPNLRFAPLSRLDWGNFISTLVTAVLRLVLNIRTLAGIVSSQQLLR